MESPQEGINYKRAASISAVTTLAFAASFKTNKERETAVGKRPFYANWFFRVSLLLLGAVTSWSLFTLATVWWVYWEFKDQKAAEKQNEFWQSRRCPRGLHGDFRRWEESRKTGWCLQCRTYWFLETNEIQDIYEAYKKNGSPLCLARVKQIVLEGLSKTKREDSEDISTYLESTCIGLEGQGLSKLSNSIRIAYLEYLRARNSQLKKVFVAQKMEKLFEGLSEAQQDEVLRKLSTI